MTSFIPFKGIRPARDKANLVATRSYLSYTKQILNEKLDNNPFTFLHILNPDYKSKKPVIGKNKFSLVKDKFKYFLKEKIFNEDKKESFYIYQQEDALKKYTGIIGASSIKDYNENKIKKHEETILERQSMFKDYLSITGFNADPVLLTYKKDKSIDLLIKKTIEKRSEYEFTTTDKIKHKFWVIDAIDEIIQIQKSFKNIDNLYIADGHHRSASSSLLQKENKKNKASNYFMSYLVDEEQLNILNFNRLIKITNGLSPDKIINLISSKCIVDKKGKKEHYPSKKDEISMYLNKNWYSLIFKKNTRRNNIVKSLDPSLLSEEILGPILEIDDERKNKNISFIDGKTPLIDLKKLVDTNEYNIAFILKPITINQIKEVADHGLSMPPKSTYIEPKLRSGLIIYKTK